MITDATDIKVITNLKGKKIDLTFDENSLAHIMSVLTDLYSDPELAVIREYSTNAWDAHVAAGCTDRAIQVDLPTALSPFLKIRDFGIGLTLEDIEEIYSKYGASTKRDTNDMVGMLGLGCKSGLAYSNQFTLISVKDGFLTKAIISRDETGAGGINILENVPSDEPNGTEIIIPANRHNRFEEKAKNFFKFWESNTVLINGKLNKKLEGEWLIEDKLMIAPYEYGEKTTHTIVMGNVPYPFEFEANLRDNRRLVAFVDIGEVNFTPSRESLQMTSKTKATIEKIKSDFYRQISKTVQKEIDLCDTAAKAIEIHDRWVSIYPAVKKTTTFTWQDEEIPDYLIFDQDVWITACSSWRKSDCHETDRIVMRAESIRDWVIVYDYDVKKFTPTIKNKLLKWSEGVRLKRISGTGTFNSGAYGYAHKQFLLMKDKPKNFWLSQMQSVSYENTIKPIKLEVKQKKAIKGSFKGHMGRSKYEVEIDLDSLEDNTIVYYYSYRGEFSQYYYDIAATTVGDYVVLFVPDNRRDKFKRDNPNAIHIKDAAQKLANDFVNRLKPIEFEAVAFQRVEGSNQKLYDLDPTKVDDPLLKHQIGLSKMDVRAISKALDMAIRSGITVVLPKVEPRMRSYPLYSHYMLHNHEQHVYDYLNTMYKKGV